MSSGDTARQAPNVEGLLHAWLQTQERVLHLLRADDFQGVCDGHLVEARLKAAAKALKQEININHPAPPCHTPRERKGAAAKALKQEININHPAPPRERKGAAERSNRFLRGVSPGTGRTRLEIARRRREATLLGEQLQYKIGLHGQRAVQAAPAACPACSMTECTEQSDIEIYL